MGKDRFRSPRSDWRRGNKGTSDETARTPDPDRRGFTLLELLIAMTLLGLIAVLLLGGLRLGARSWEAGSARNEQTSEVQVVQTFIRQQLSRARDLVPVLRGPARRPAFEGTREAITFIAPLPGHLAVGGLYRLSLYLSEEGEQNRLMVSWRLFQSGADDGDARFDDDATVLLDHIENVEFSYFGSERKDGERDWQDEWQDQDRRPEMVRIRVEFAEGDGRYWPELVVAPKIGWGE